MRTFGELLTEFMHRTGTSDSELARTLEVRRQTIFRWKEGLVERPRHRDDILLIAKKLRLTPEERDELLLAAGFAPETPETIAPISSSPIISIKPVPTNATIPTAPESTAIFSTVSSISAEPVQLPEPIPSVPAIPSPRRLSPLTLGAILIAVILVVH